MANIRNTFRPKSIDEIRRAFTDWWKENHRSRAPYFHFSRSSPASNRLRMRSQLARKMKLRLQKNELSCELAGRKFHLLLDDFDVKAEVDGRTLSFEFKLSSVPARRYERTPAALQEPKHSIFISRGRHALAGLEQQLSAERIVKASSAPTDYMVLVEALTEPSLGPQLAAEDPLVAARLRGVKRQQSLVEESGRVLRAQQVAEILGISRQAVDKRRRQSQLIGLTQGRRGYAYPAWQFENGRTIADLELVLARLRDHDPWMKLTFFINPNDRLNGASPLQTLRSGKTESVLQAAESYGVQGAA
jgi:biotin operon repressor